MHADRSVALVGEAVHVTIHVHVRERIARLENLVLPDLGGLEIIGDERNLSTSAGGTDYVEQLTLVGLAPGEARLTPAHLDAIDARNGVPTRFSSNPLTIRIVATREPSSSLWLRWGRTLLVVLVGAGVLVAALVLAAIVLLALARRSGPATAPPPPPTVLYLPDSRSGLRAALEQMRREPGREGALAVRAALRSLAGAGPDETLAEVLLRLDGSNSALRGALRLAERAAFVDDSRLQASIEELTAAVEAMLR